MSFKLNISSPGFWKTKKSNTTDQPSDANSIGPSPGTSSPGLLGFWKTKKKNATDQPYDTNNTGPSGAPSSPDLDSADGVTTNKPLKSNENVTDTPKAEESINRPFIQFRDIAIQMSKVLGIVGDASGPLSILKVIGGLIGLVLETTKV